MLFVPDPRSWRVALGLVTVLVADACAPRPQPADAAATLVIDSPFAAVDIEHLASLLRVADTRRSDTAVVDRALASPTAFVRAYAVRVIGQVGISSRAGVVRSLVANTDSTIAADAAFALGLLHDSSATNVLAVGLGAAPTVASAAAWSLGELGEVARPTLETTLKEGRPATSLADVLQAAAKLRPVPAGLIAPYLDHTDLRVQRSAAYALTRSRVPGSVSALLALERRPSASPTHTSPDRSDVEVDLRSYVARGLGRTVAGDSLGDDARAALRRLVEDPHAHVRINAIRSLSTYGPRARADLVRHLTDPDGNARVAVAQSLGGVLAVPSPDWSAAWAADTGFTFRRALLSTAVRAGARMPALDTAGAEAWQRRSDWHFRAAAAEAAGVGGQAAVDAIAAPLFRDSDARVRAAAFQSASGWTDSASAATRPYARAALPGWLHDDDLFVRASILNALRDRARASDAIVALAAWRRAATDPENDARVAALGVIAAAWATDSASFGALRDSIASLAPSADPVERNAVRRVGPFISWSGAEIPAQSTAYYLDRVRTILVPSLLRRPPRARITTERGMIDIEFAGADAPLTVGNFITLARHRYYDGLAFHRVVPNFVAQDGDPRGDGSGGPGYAIRDELNRQWYERGAVGMALSGPDTGGSQYFLTHSPQPHLDGHYTVFGRVTRGLNVLDSIVQGDRILSIVIQ